MNRELREYLKNKLDLNVLHLQRVQQGVSTEVYHLNPDHENLYVRILPEKKYTYSPVVEAHKTAEQRGLRVPKVRHFEDCSPALDGKSIMVVESMLGRHLTNEDSVPDEMLIELGTQIALFSSIKTNGYGWIERKITNVNQDDLFKGIFSSVYEDLTHKLDSRMKAYADRELLTKTEIRDINRLSEKLEQLKTDTEPILCHTDLSYEHVFIKDNGEFEGIIDLDDLRGSNIFLDLAEMSKGFKQRHFKHILKGFKLIIEMEPDLFDYGFKLTRLFWFIEKGYWVRDMSNDPKDNKYWQIFMKDLKELS